MEAPATSTAVRARDHAGVPPGARVVDADVHLHLPSMEALFPYLAAHWREAITLSGQPFYYRPYQMLYPPNVPTSQRPGATILQAASAAEGLDRLRAELLDEWGVTHAIASVTHFVDLLHNPYLADAIASAINDWMIAEWLEPEPRLRGAMLVSAEQPQHAVREIERVGGNPSIVSVFLPARSSRPYGNPIFRPIFEAAAAQGLAVGIHYGGWPGNAPSAVGYASYYVEEWIGRAQLAQTQLTSIVSEGLFASVPEARVAFVECGWAWLPAYLWRFDKDWKGLRRETPWVDRLPSEYVREFVKFTLQPVDGPEDPRHLARVIEQVRGLETLMFSTDYPHWHDDDGPGAIPAPLLADGSGALADTAAAFYRLDG